MSTAALSTLSFVASAFFSSKHLPQNSQEVEDILLIAKGRLLEASHIIRDITYAKTSNQEFNQYADECKRLLVQVDLIKAISEKTAFLSSKTKETNILLMQARECENKSLVLLETIRAASIAAKHESAEKNPSEPKSEDAPEPSTEEQPAYPGELQNLTTFAAQLIELIKEESTGPEQDEYANQTALPSTLSELRKLTNKLVATFPVQSTQSDPLRSLGLPPKSIRDGLDRLRSGKLRKKKAAKGHAARRQNTESSFNDLLSVASGDSRTHSISTGRQRSSSL